MGMDPAQAEQMPALARTPDLAQDIRNAANFQFERSELVPCVLAFLDDFLGNLHSSMLVWEKLVAFRPDVDFSSRADDNEWFNSQYRVLKWREALTARIYAIYWFEFAPPRGIIPNGPLLHNESLTERINN